MKESDLSSKSKHDVSVISEWSKMVGMPYIQSIILAINLAKNYEKLEIENRALKILLESTRIKLELINNIIIEERMR
jgi:hypothetical protein